jgi:hypothetical protein
MASQRCTASPKSRERCFFLARNLWITLGIGKVIHAGACALFGPDLCRSVCRNPPLAVQERVLLPVWRPV